MAVLKQSLSGYKNIYYITEILDKPVVNRLISLCDVMVSLHRSEGFGLVMAEAMLLGTVCIATDWSSNTEFMNSDVACMVGCRMVPVQGSTDIYPEGSAWADADIEEASYYMKKLASDQRYYKNLSKNALVYANDKLGREATSKLLIDVLKDIESKLNE